MQLMFQNVRPVQYSLTGQSNVRQPFYLLLFCLWLLFVLSCLVQNNVTLLLCILKYVNLKHETLGEILITPQPQNPTLPHLPEKLKCFSIRNGICMLLLRTVKEGLPTYCLPAPPLGWEEGVMPGPWTLMVMNTMVSCQTRWNSGEMFPLKSREGVKRKILREESRWWCVWLTFFLAVF